MQAERAPPPRRKTVVIIDDHDIVRFGLETLVNACPQLRLAGSAEDVQGGLRLIETLQPDLVISDMGTRDSRGLDTVRAVVAAQTPRSVLIVSTHDELLYGAQAIALGARGYVMKESAHASVIAAALSILEGGTWVSPRLNAKLMGRLFNNGTRSPAPESDGLSLSAREFEVLELLKSGMSTKQIASTLHVSGRTVDIYRASMKRKLGLRTGAELIAFASSRL
jgi:DNA-binding NarL/FixJ family response regulator